MTPCEARSVASAGATTRCSGPARCTPCGVAPRSPSATGPVTRGRCTARAPHARHGSARHPPRQVTAHHPVRAAGAVPGRPGEPSFRRFQAERAAGGGHHICAYFQRLGVRGLRDGRLLPAGHRPADLHEPVHGPGRRRPENGRLGAQANRRRPDRPGSTTPTAGCSTGPSATGRPWPSARRSPRRAPGRDSSRLRSGRGPQLPVQGRTHPQQGPLGGHRRRPGPPPPSGSTGTTRCAPTAPSACALRPSTRPPGSPTPTTRNNHNRPPPEPTNRASTKPGA